MDIKQRITQAQLRQQAYFDGMMEQSLILKAKDNDMARVAAYKELKALGEDEAAQIALTGVCER